MANPALIAGAISAGGGILGSVVNAVSSRSNMKLQHRYNTEMIDKQNAYNTPLNQRQRWEEAGFNPYLMASDAGNQPAAGQSSLATPDVGTPISQAAQSVGAAVMEYPQIKSQIELNKAEQSVKDEQARGQRIENDYKAAQQISDIHMKLAQIDKMVEDNRLTKYQADLLRDSYQDQLAAFKKQNTILDKTADKIDAETSLTIAKKSTESANRLLALANAAKSDAERRQIEAIIPHLAEYYESMVYANRRDTWETVAGRVLGKIVDYVTQPSFFDKSLKWLEKEFENDLVINGFKKGSAELDKVVNAAIELVKKLPAKFAKAASDNPMVFGK